VPFPFLGIPMQKPLCHMPGMGAIVPQRRHHGQPLGRCCLPGTSRSNTKQTSSRGTEKRTSMEHGDYSRQEFKQKIAKVAKEETDKQGKTWPITPIQATCFAAFATFCSICFLRQTRMSAPLYQCITQPPSMFIVWPVIVAARSEARKTARAAICSGVCHWPRGHICLTLALPHSS
jgi:hypothetical protein